MALVAARGAFGAQPGYWIVSRKCFKSNIFTGFNLEEQQNINNSLSKNFI